MMNSKIFSFSGSIEAGHYEPILFETSSCEVELPNDYNAVELKELKGPYDDNFETDDFKDIKYEYKWCCICRENGNKLILRSYIYKSDLEDLRHIVNKEKPPNVYCTKWYCQKAIRISYKYS